MKKEDFYNGASYNKKLLGKYNKSWFLLPDDAILTSREAIRCNWSDKNATPSFRHLFLKIDHSQTTIGNIILKKS